MRPPLPPSTTAAASSSLWRGIAAQQQHARASYSRGRNAAIGTPASSTSGPQLARPATAPAAAVGDLRRRGRLLEQAQPGGGIVVAGGQQQHKQQQRAFHASTRAVAPKRDFYEVLGTWGET